MWDVSGDGMAPAPVAKMVCEQMDFKSACRATMAAQTIEDTGHFHVCPYGEQRPLSSSSCADMINAQDQFKVTLGEIGVVLGTVRC
jgi:hypothetical protein